MKIRYATENDDFNVLARLMYETDRYIYPYWFEENKDEGIKVIAELMKQENTSFYYKKCLVAEIDGKIVGMLVYFNKECPLDFKYSKIIDKNFNYNYTLTKYFIPLEKSVEENETYVAGIRVDDLFTRRGIAEALLRYLFKILPKNSNVTLDVLVKNTPALKLYQKVGFEIVEAYNGFNGYRKRRPPCYSMVKNL